MGAIAETIIVQKKWVDTQKVMAVAYDTPINGYKTNTTINLRLWKAMPFSVFAPVKRIDAV